MKSELVVKYTVVLLKPEILCDAFIEYGQEIYVAHVKSESWRGAVEAAQKEVCVGDLKNNPGLVISPLDYKLCCLFDGHIQPALYGWQL